MSALIATAYIIVGGPETIDILDELQIPDDVLENLEHKLQPLLEGIELGGYEGYKTRKVYVIGNKGRLC